MDMGWHVTVKAAHTNLLSLRSARAGYCCSIAALLFFFGSESLQNATAEGETRTISFHHIHTGEDLTITYKVNGRYDDEALNKINNELRDWRESETIKMDPHLIDLLWEVHREVGAKGPIWVVCGYRSPETNSMLRRRSSGVAKFSQHMLGKAVDFYIPGVTLEDLRAAGLRAQRGGVGYYPTSGAPFVHLDTGSVRHWPRMPEAQLASVLAKGRLGSTLASDGKGTAVAQAERSRQPSFFLARLFGGGKDEEEDAQTAAAPAPAAAKAGATSRTGESRVAKAAAVASAASTRGEKTAAVPFPQAKPAKPETYQVASADSRPIAKVADRYQVASAASESIPAPARPTRAAIVVAQADMPVNDILNARGYWQGLPTAEPAETPPVGAARATPRQAAAAEPAASATPWPLADRASDPIPNALAYAAQPTPIAAARAVPMGVAKSRAVSAAPAETTVAVKRSDNPPSVMPPKAKIASVVRVGDHFNDPWMRAMIVSPSAQSFLKTTVLGVPDFRNLRLFMQKPASTMVLTFSNDPHHGMTSEQFDGSAVVFLSTATFSTASLR